MSNNIIIGNFADERGGGMACGSGVIAVNNCIMGNTADSAGGGIDIAGSPEIVNTIVRSNTAARDPDISPGGGWPIVNYCNIEGGWPGRGNIDVDPMFRDTPGGDYRLMSITCGDLFNSPCIDAGSPNILDTLLHCSWGLGTVISDIGAYGGGYRVERSAGMIIVPDDYPSIQEGMDASTAGDTILVMPGIYIENLYFPTHNTVLGSMYMLTNDPVFISITIIDGNEDGSVIFVQPGADSTSVICGFTIRNGRDGAGAGIYCDVADPIIRGNIIRDNTAFHEYGGVGGGILCLNASPAIIDNAIIDNYANDVGGGICLLSSHSRLVNNFIVGNTADSCGGGGLFLSYSDPLLIDNTISRNHGSLEGGGALCRYVNAPYIVNTILWANDAESGSEVALDSTSTIAFAYSDIQGGWEGQGNLDIDPQFRDPDHGDFHLQTLDCGDSADSPCIDTGNPAILDSILSCIWGLGTERSDIGACGGLDLSQTAMCHYAVGDANNSGGFDGIDVVYCVNYLKGHGNPPPVICDCMQYGMLYAAADANGNCEFNGLDVTYSVNYLKGLGPSPTACPGCPPSLLSSR